MAAALLSRVWSSSVSGPRYFLRCSATCSVEKWFSKQSSSDNRPKQPLTAYIRFYKEQQPFYKKQNPDVSVVDITKKIAHAWRELPASDKQPYEAAAKTDRQIYKEQMIKYKAQLTPAQEAALKEEKRRRVEKRRAARKKRAKMKNLFEEWQKMSSSQKKTYQQLAEDDKIRYENEMKSWEEQMAEIGREDLIRFKNRRKLSKRKKTEKKVASKKRATTLKKPSGSKVASAAAKKKVKARQSEE
ncbi:transcription factor A, mitochondrial isoform X2 [Podarcis raffonei]|uniref:transcription factor A, mitochondrial isoform X2 n=1 Tax=Podarcis raffonei TaxID=65483 RepID=UPI00232990A8|nr:transcription factor A, mitochondrial isoform X2 [Podarcis raffonei]